MDDKKPLGKIGLHIHVSDETKRFREAMNQIGQQLAKITLPQTVALCNPALVDNMARIDQVVSDLRAFGLVTDDQVNRLFTRMGYTQTLPEVWTMETYAHERSIMERFKDDVAAGHDVDTLIASIKPFKKELIWRNGIPYWIVKPASEQQEANYKYHVGDGQTFLHEPGRESARLIILDDPAAAVEEGDWEKLRDWYEQPRFATAPNDIVESELAAARQRSRDDLKAKRRDLRKRKGKL